METREPTDLAMGIAGEHLVCADLLMNGYRAFLAEQVCPYDIAVEYDCKLVRIQVKSTRFARNVPQRENRHNAYMWNVRRAGKGGRRIYSQNDFDLLALVALDIKKIAYLPPSKTKQTIHIRQPDVAYSSLKTGKTFEMYPFEKALEEVLL